MTIIDPCPFDSDAWIGDNCNACEHVIAAHCPEKKVCWVCEAISQLRREFLP